MAQGLLEGRFLEDASVEEKKLSEDLQDKINDTATKAENIPTVVQVTGDSERTVISQKAVSEALNQKANASDLAKYLPLTGGTLTGRLVTTAGATNGVSFGGNSTLMYRETTTGQRLVISNTAAGGIELTTQIATYNGTEIATVEDLPGDYVPKTRTVNGKALSANITLAAADVGAPTIAEFNTLKTQVSGLKTLQKMVIAMTAAGTAVMTTAVTAANIFQVHYARMLLNEDDYTISGTTFSIATTGIEISTTQKVVITYYA